MFSELLTELTQGRTGDPDLLARRFDLAMTKKLSIVKLPPAFWMQDPKINPRADHLLQAALVLADRERWQMAHSVLAVELNEQGSGQELDQVVERIVSELLASVPAELRGQLAQQAEEMELVVRTRIQEPETRNP